MTETLLRPTVEADLPALSDLTDAVFGRRRSVDLLRWLVLGGDSGVALDSRVAVRDGRVVGHAAVVSGRYRWPGRTVVGVHPILWLVAADARGRTAMQLGAWSTATGDFSLVVGGTPKSQPLLDRRRFVRCGTAVELHLPAVAAPGGPWDLVPLDRDPAGGDRDPADATDDGTRTGLTGDRDPADTTTELTGDGDRAAAAGDRDARVGDGAVASRGGAVVAVPGRARLAWLAAAPGLESRLLTLRHEDRELGPVLLYIDRRATPPGARIVHLPSTPDDLAGALRRILAELAAAGCARASYLASCPAQQSAALQLGGEPFYERPIFFRAQRDLPTPAAWHLSYLEGDLAYRRI